MAAPRRKALLSWSTGKDSAWALHRLRQEGQFEVVGLLTTVTREYARVSMHGVREELLEAQARAVGLPVRRVQIPPACSNEAYEAAMREAMDGALAEGIDTVAFGDLFLEDLRRYREEKLAGIGMQAAFPLWGLPTAELARTMVEAGLRAVVTCLDPRVLARSFAGRIFEAAFLDELPPGVDPCGERGEFHSFAYAGPMFPHPIPIRVGEAVEREGFVFNDVTLEAR